MLEDLPGQLADPPCKTCPKVLGDPADPYIPCTVFYPPLYLASLKADSPANGGGFPVCCHQARLVRVRPRFSVGLSFFFSSFSSMFSGAMAGAAFVWCASPKNIYLCIAGVSPKIVKQDVHQKRKRRKIPLT